MNKDKILYTIIRGRTSINVSGLILYIDEPDPNLIHESYEIYDQVYQDSYMNGLYIEQEIQNLLIEHDIWTPIHESNLKEARDNIENLKVEAFENFFRNKELRHIKLKLESCNKKIATMMKSKTFFNHLSCENIAENARFSWLIYNSCSRNGVRIKEDEFDITDIIKLYNEKVLKQEDIRAVAKYDKWRIIWANNKLHGGKLFNKYPVDFSNDQLILCSFSQMYDSVYEHPESPHEKIIEDDICLDGWFITQKRKQEKDKKQTESNDILKNSKIKNSKEIFIMSNSQEDANLIYSMNDSASRSIIQNRENVIKEKGRATDTDFSDVQSEITLKRNQAFINMMKGNQ